MKTILNEYKIHNADVTLRMDATTEDLIDVVEGNRVYIPCIYILNKIDQISIEVRVYNFGQLCYLSEQLTLLMLRNLSIRLLMHFTIALVHGK